MRNLGLDIGDKRIGVAVSDPSGILASPLTIISYQDETEAIEAILDIIARQKISLIIVGLPRALDGHLGEQAEKVQAFVSKLASRTSVPIKFRDERLTTVLARRLMRTDSRRGKKKTGDDAIAAALILQNYLDEPKEETDRQTA